MAAVAGMKSYLEELHERMDRETNRLAADPALVTLAVSMGNVSGAGPIDRFDPSIPGHRMYLYAADELIRRGFDAETFERFAADEPEGAAALAQFMVTLSNY